MLRSLGQGPKELGQTTSVFEWVCPSCGYPSDSVDIQDKKYFCVLCAKLIASSDADLQATAVERKFPARICPICNTAVAIHKGNRRMDGFGYSCIMGHFTWYEAEGQLFTADDLLKPTIRQLGLGKTVDGPIGLSIIFDPKEIADVIVLKVLMDEARNEDHSFTAGPADTRTFRSWVFLCEGQFAGYLAWNRFTNEPCLRQIYVRPGFRRRGIASRAVCALIEEEGRGEAVIESPNENMNRVLMKLGYVTEKNGHFRARHGIGFVFEG